MGLKRFFKRAGKATVDINKGVFGGGYVKDLVKHGVSATQKLVAKNPEVAGAALGAAGPWGSLLGGLLGAGGGSSSSQPQPQLSEPLPADPGLAPGFTPQHLLIGGGALLALLVVTRK